MTCCLNRVVLPNRRIVGSSRYTMGCITRYLLRVDGLKFVLAINYASGSFEYMFKAFLVLVLFTPPLLPVILCSFLFFCLCIALVEVYGRGLKLPAPAGNLQRLGLAVFIRHRNNYSICTAPVEGTVEPTVVPYNFKDILCFRHKVSYQ